MGVTVVILSDDAMLRTELAALLEAEGMTVLTAHEATFALALCAAIRPAVVVADVVSGGLALARELQDDIPIILRTQLPPEHILVPPGRQWTVVGMHHAAHVLCADVLSLLAPRCQAMSTNA